MRKIFIFLLFFFSISQTHSAWYGSVTIPKNINAGATWCPTDGDVTGGSPSFPNTPNAGNHSYDSRVISESGINMTCEYWDDAIPDQLSLNYFNGWTNTGQTITIQARDLGGSRLKRIILQESQNGGSWINVADFDNLPDPIGTVVTKTFIRTSLNGNTFVYRLLAYDYAGNTSSYTSPNIINFGTTVPDQLGINYLNGWTNTGQTITMQARDIGGSRLKRIRLFETQNGGSAVMVQDWDNLPNPVGAIVTKTFNRTVINGSNFQYYIIADNYAGNTSSYTSPNILRFDSIVPDQLSLNYANGSSNTGEIITYQGRDIGGSRLKRLMLLESQNGGAWVTVQDFDNLTDPVGTVVTKTFTRIPVNGSTFQYYIIGYDYAGNTQGLVNPNIISFDTILPDQLSLNYLNGWTNTTQTVTLQSRDLGGSKLKQVILYQSQNGGAWTTVGNWDNLSDPVGTLVTRTFLRSVVNGSSFVYYILAYDYAGNYHSITSPNILRFDTIAPTDADITPFPANGTNLLANNSEPFSISVNPSGGSPVGVIKVQMEQPTPINIMDTEITGTNSPFSFTKDISLVDNDRLPNGARSYALKINQVCDQAGNCNNTPFAGVPFLYNVYANPNLVTAPGVSTITTNTLDDTTNIADGSTKNITITLKDRYNNAIIPATGLGRQIDVKFTTDNALYLDQYKRSGASSVFTTLSNQVDVLGNYAQRFSIGNGVTTTLSNQSSTTGLYTYLWKIYTPTASSNSLIDPNARFTLNALSVDVTGTLGRNNIPIGVTPLSAYFKPLFTTALAGNIRTNGFLEGSIQPNTLTLTKNSSPSGITNDSIYLEFGSGTNQTSPSFDLFANSTNPPTTQLKEGNQPAMTGLAPAFQTPITVGISNLFTKFTQTLGAPFAPNAQLYLSSHIGYRLDGHDIAYNGDIIGKSNYFGAVITNDAGQNGIKVTGITSSQNTSEIITNQFTNDISILGSVYKAELKKDIVKNVYNTTKQITTSNGTNSITDITNFALNADGKKLSSDSILYFGGLAGGNVTLGNGTAEKVTGKKTIVIVGGNLYIKSDMYYNDKANDILGVIVLKDANGLGGNVYIDPSVTNLVGTFIMDRSMISYNGSELGGDTLQSVLANQLHIYGSVFSENTIGGSRANPIKCPFYIGSSACTQTEAQKYDLNYLRRYILNATTGLPVGNGKVIGGGTCTNPTKSCTGGNPSFSKNITNVGTDTYKNYPVVIEYNPTISQQLPPLFGN